MDKNEQLEEFKKLKAKMYNLLLHCISSSIENFGITPDNVSQHYLEELREALSYVRCAAEYLPHFEDYHIRLVENQRRTL